MASDEATFLQGLQDAVDLAEAGDPSGVRAMKEAVLRRISGHETDVEFYVPRVAVRTFEHTSNAGDRILDLAKRHALLQDPKTSGELIVIYTTHHDFSAVEELAYKVASVGGKDEFFAFQLLFNISRSSVKAPDIGRPELVGKLTASDEATFLQGLQEAVDLAEAGDPSGVRAMKEAVLRRRHGSETDVEFYEPRIAVRVSRRKTFKAQLRIIHLAKRHTLLHDPKTSGELIDIYTTNHTFRGVRHLAYMVKWDGGTDEFFAFQLLFNITRSSVKAMNDRLPAVCLPTSPFF
jgi:hypothetical protein